MRRTVRALSVAALASVVLGFVASAAFADPAAEVSPSSVSPGASVTVSVSCATTGGPAPATVEATSQAFDEGTVQLQRVAGNDDQASGAAYRGTARIAPAGDLEAGQTGVGQDSAWTVDGTCPAAPGGQGKPWSATFDVSRDGGAKACTDSHPDCGGTQPCTEPRPESCGQAVIQRGVEAGEGGSLTGSVPALVAGGLLVTGALGAAVYRVRHKDSGTEG